MVAVRVPLSSVLPLGGPPPLPPFPPGNPPTNSAPPSVTGELVEAQTLTADVGLWVDVITYAYQWRRCNAAGASCADIVGATSPTYLLAAADTGSTVRVVVTATNEEGSTQATSAPTGVVGGPTGGGALAPANTGLPNISGTPTSGQTFSVGPGSWDGDTPMTFAYQWRRCDSGGGSCADIAAATNPTYTTQAADETKTIRCRVTATNAAGSAFADSAASLVIAAVPPPASGFTNLNRVLSAQGGVTKQGVYRGQTDGSEKFYAAHSYNGGHGDLVATDPADWSSIAYPFPYVDAGAWSMTYHPVEKNLYLGTYLNGRVLRFNTTSEAFADLGGSGLQYVWEMAYSPFNQKVYGCGSNSSKLFRLDGSTIVDLGTINNSGGNQYARWMVADPNPANPYLYIGCGVNTPVLVAYNINTAVKTVLSAPGGSGTFTVDRTESNEVWAYYANTHLKCSGGTAAAWPAHPSPPFDDNKFSNGDKIDVKSGSVVITAPGGAKTTHPYTYAGKPVEMWRVGQGPDGKVYGSGAIPAWLTMLYDPSNVGTPETLLGNMGGGQLYAFLVNGSNLWMTMYGANHVFLKYNPAAAISPIPFVAGGASSNPQTTGGTSDWRPNCLINAPDGQIYSGTCGSYGQLSGRLIKIDPATRVSTVITPYSNQGVNGLGTTPTAALGIAGSWALIGSTTIQGGAGAVPTAATAELFTVNPANFQVVNKIALPITGIEDLAEIVTDGTFMYAIGTDKTSGSRSYVFKYNHATNTFVGSGTLLPFTTLMYNTAVVYQSHIVGLCQQGVYKIPLSNLAGGTIVNFPTWPAAHINTGGVFDAGTWYFTSGTGLWKYVMP